MNKLHTNKDHSRLLQRIVMSTRNQFEIETVLIRPDQTVVQAHRAWAPADTQDVPDLVEREAKAVAQWVNGNEQVTVHVDRYNRKFHLMNDCWVYAGMAEREELQIQKGPRPREGTNECKEPPLPRLHSTTIG